MPETSDFPNPRMEWIFPEDIITRFSNNIVIQHSESEFILSFFETRPPLLIGEESIEKLKNVKSIPAECVARIVIPVGRMPGMVEAIQTNFEKYLKHFGGGAATETDKVE